MTLPVVLYGCESWSVTPSEERRRRVFGNKVLRRIFGPNKDEVTDEWRKLHYSGDQIEMGWTGHVARMGERRGAYRVTVGKPEGRRPNGRPRCIWEDNIKMDRQEMGWGAWTGLI